MDFAGDPSDPLAAVDGGNTAVVVGDSQSSSVHVAFHALEDGVWERKRPFEKELSKEHAAAILGDTALAGLPSPLDSSGALLLCEKGRSGNATLWERVASPSIPSSGVARWGRPLGLDGDLA